jgi:hypothetical protein
MPENNSRRLKKLSREALPGKRFVRVFVLLLIGLGFGSGVVSADYIGPNRTYTIQQATGCRLVFSGSGAACSGYLGDPCTCSISCGDCLRPDLSCSGIPESQVNFQCGSSGFGEIDRYVSYTTVTISHPPAVASTIWSCPISGDNGWCQSQYTVQLNGSDPLSGYYITALEGTLDGAPFFADGQTSISFLLGEGAHHLDFWALSSYGDSSYHKIEDYYIDTQVPVIDASLNGTAGDNNWFVSDTVLSVLFSDPTPGSGLAGTAASANGTGVDVSVPVTFPEGIYALQLDARDVAGLTSQVLYTLMVDTTAPALTANQPPAESGIYMNGSVIFSGSSADATSGVNRIEVAPDGVNWQPAALNPDGSWTLDWDSSVKPDSTYTPLVASTDNAGNRTEITLQSITLDNSAPAMSLTAAWYIWETGHASVRDTRSGIERIELSIRDDQNRWPATGWQFETDHLEYDINWNRQFEDGTWAPTGNYQVLLQAWDRLGNERYITGRIYIPAAGETPIATRQGIIIAGVLEETAEPTVEGTPAVGMGTTQESTLTPTRTQMAVAISGGAAQTVFTAADASSSEAPKNATPLSAGILWGAAAVAAGAAAAIVSAKQLKETRAKEEAKIYEKIREGIARRWDQMVARLEAANEEQRQKRLYETALIDLNIKIQRGMIAKEDAEAQAEKIRLYYSTGGHAMNDIPTTVDYSDQVKTFREGEAASNDSYQQYLAEKFREAEQESIDSFEEYQVELEIPSNPSRPNVFSPVTSSIAIEKKSVSTSISSPGPNVFTPVTSAKAMEETKSINSSIIYDFFLGAGKEIVRANTWLLAVTIPKSVEYYQPSSSESSATLLGRVFGDFLTLLMGIAEVTIGIGGSGVGIVVSCGTTLCLTSGGVLVAGAVITTVGGLTVVSGATAIGENYYNFSHDGRSSSNAKQNSQFDAAVKEIEKKIGRKLSHDEIHQILHHELHYYSNPGYDEIVEIGVDLFGGSE